MSILGKLLGAQSSGNAIYAKVGGVQTIVQEGVVKVDGAYVSFHKNVIEKLLTSTTNAVMQDLFTVDEWASTTPKLVTVPAGEIIGSNDNLIEALRTGTGGGGLITLNILGEIQGAGGSAGSGVGGDALNIEQAITLINDGFIRAGGGGGGLGGVGGQGQYTGTTSQSAYTSGRQAQVGVSNGTSYYKWDSGWYTTTSWGGWNYSRGAHKTSNTSVHIYAINRSQSVTLYSTGGTGGAGGRGIGYDAAAAAGIAGVAGGTDAGAGGTGGAGGAWGATGDTGLTGDNGDYTNGVVGVAGGLAGNAILGIGNVALTNNGTIQGIQA